MTAGGNSTAEIQSGPSEATQNAELIALAAVSAVLIGTVLAIVCIGVTRLLDRYRTRNLVRQIQTTPPSVKILKLKPSVKHTRAESAKSSSCASLSPPVNIIGDEKWVDTVIQQQQQQKIHVNGSQYV